MIAGAVLAILTISIGLYAVLNGSPTGAAVVDTNGMKPSISITGSAVEITNTNKYDWNNVKLTINGRYNCPADDKIIAGENLSVELDKCRSGTTTLNGEVEQVAISADEGAVAEFIY